MQKGTSSSRSAAAGRPCGGGPRVPAVVHRRPYVAQRLAVPYTFFGKKRLQNVGFSATHFKMHDLPPLISQSRQFRKTNAPHIALVTYRPSHHAAHHPTLFMIITRQTFKKRRCALQHISESRRVAQNVSALDLKSQFAVPTTCACADTAAKFPSLKSSVHRRAAVPPQPCTPWRLAWYAG